MNGRPFAIIDVETTGMNPLRDRVIEVAVIRNDGKEEFSTLVNPGRFIPPFITSLTGITDDELESAPFFGDIALELAGILEGAVFVAHNARFDYAFIRNEFKRAGISFSAPTLCTLRLSRKLYPKSGKHSLERIIQRHSIVVSSRHRALDDARAVNAFLAIARRERGEAHYAAALGALLKLPSLPAALPERMVRDLPDGPGVYLFHGDNGELLYVGKSKNVRERVLAHFAADHGSEKEMALARSVRSIEARPTHGELSALLLEAELVRECNPAYNQRLQKRRRGVAAYLTVTAGGYETLALNATDGDEGDAGIAALFSSRRAAEEEIALLAKAYQLCPKILGIEKGKGKGACFAHQLKRCHGACIGLEEPASYNRRFRDAFAFRSVEKWPYSSPILISEEGEGGMGSAYAVDRWRILASIDYDGDGSFRVRDAGRPYDRHTSRILQGFLREPRGSIRVRQISASELSSLLGEQSSF
ncbi:MAG TPA: exonuclease domain-containing protein [Geobacteraceae bacterium]